MSINCNNSGTNVTLNCDLCGARITSTHYIKGHWTDPKTNRRINRPALVCDRCNEKLRELRGDK